VVISLPPLRGRREDIPELVRYFLQKHGPALGTAQPSILPEALKFFQEQAWPGNVRHLENVVRKVLLMNQGYTINLDHARAALNQIGTTFSSAGPFGDYIDHVLAAVRRGESADAYARVIETAEKELFTRAIRQADGNQAKASRWLGVSRITMKAKLVQFGLHASVSKESEAGSSEEQ
jgi:DNA-binding NtrC family response regulator